MMMTHLRNDQSMGGVWARHSTCEAWHLEFFWPFRDGNLMRYCDTLQPCILRLLNARDDNTNTRNYDNQTLQMLAYDTTTTGSSATKSTRYPTPSPYTLSRPHTVCFFAFSALSAACLSALLLTFSAFLLSRFVSLCPPCPGCASLPLFAALVFSIS